MLTQFKVKKGIEIINGSNSVFYGVGVPSATNPVPTAHATLNDLYIDSDTQRLYKFNGSAWVLSGTVNRMGDGAFNGNYVTNIDDGGVNTFTKAIKDLDTRAKTNADQIQTLVSGANPQGFAFAMTGDVAHFGTAVAGPVAGAVIPSDADELFSPSDADVMFCVDGTKWVYSSASTNWTKDTLKPLAVKDMWAIGKDLTNRAGQELTAIYIFTAAGFIKFGEVTNDVASAIGLSVGYTAGKGVVSISDTVQSALQKLDGNIGNRTFTNDFNVADDDTVTQAIDKLDGAIGERNYLNQFEIVDGESLASSIDKIDSAIGDRSSYASNPKIVSNGDTLATAIGKLDQAAGFAINVSSNTGSITASHNRLNANNAIAIKWYITVIETPASGRGAVYSSEVIAIYQGAGTDDNFVDATEYGVVQIGNFDSAPALSFGFSGAAVNIGVTASKAGSTINISVKGMLLGEFTNNI